MFVDYVLWCVDLVVVGGVGVCWCLGVDGVECGVVVGMNCL